VLVLTRKAAEEIEIDGEVKVMVLNISKSRIRILITAPDRVPIRRGEAVKQAVGEPKGGSLVLSRKLNQEVLIGTTILKVLELSGSRAKLGLQAPSDSRILRGELVGGGEAA